MLYSIRDVLNPQLNRATLHKVAVVDRTRRLTYAELLERSGSMAGVLNELGVRKGDRVGIFLNRSVETVIALFGTWFAGGVAVVINERLRRKNVHHIVEHSGASCVVTESQRLCARPYFPRGKVINIDQIRPPRELYPLEPVVGADRALLVYRAGSTGLPKGVMLRHDNILSEAQIVSDYLHLTERDVILSVLPFSFEHGLSQLLASLLVGGTLVIQRSLSPPDICQTLRTERITGLAGVPTLWLQLIGRGSPFLETKYSALRYITNSGGRLPKHTVQLIRAAHPHVQIYLMHG
jgi:acyl-CoA synthetase (AMP-forming)/AMP-acid ligase II